MTSKSLFACLLILALVASFAEGLTIRTKHNRQTQVKHMVRQFSNKVQSHLLDLLHVKHSIDDDDSFIFELIGLAFSDPEIFDSLLNNKPLSEGAAGHIKDFFRNSQSFKAQIVQMFQENDTPDCLKNLSKSQQNRIVEIIIDNMDFQTILNKNESKKSGSD